MRLHTMRQCSCYSKQCMNLKSSLPHCLPPQPAPTWEAGQRAALQGAERHNSHVLIDLTAKLGRPEERAATVAITDVPTPVKLPCDVEPSGSSASHIRQLAHKS